MANDLKGYMSRLDTIRNTPINELRKLYTSLRNIVQKRIKRLSNSEYSKYFTGKYSKKGGVPKLAELKTDRSLIFEYYDLLKFAESKSGSIAEIKKSDSQRVKTLNEHGYDFINEGNVRKFGDFMEYMRSVHNNMEYDSEGVATFIQENYDVFSTKSYMEIKTSFDKWERSRNSPISRHYNTQPVSSDNFNKMTR